MMKAKRIKTWLMGLTVAAAIALQGMTALAAQTGSITIVPSFTNDKSEATPIADSASFDIYKVGEVKPGTSVTEFDLTGGAFDGFNNEVEITKKTMEDKAAELPIALAKYAADNKIRPDRTTVSNKPDTEVADLSEGLYLAVQTTPFEHYYDVLPFLIIMPEGSETDYEYEVKAMPKTTKRSSGGGGGSSSGGGPGGNPSTDPNGPTGKPTVESTVEPEGEGGRVFGAVRDKLADTPIGRVLGASRRAKTGDESSMRTYGVVFCGAVVLLGAWGVMKKKKKDADL
ncbi:MAG: hypothetical protein UF438_07515 [Oribacterium sp.]|nr:hypothetical protein [Oribacterium sp.]